MDTFDKFLRNRVNEDKIKIDIDKSTFNHLHYMVNLNAIKSDVKKNSMFGFISDFLSPRFIAVKIAFVSILFILMIGNNQNKRYSTQDFLCDSTFIQNNSPFDTLSYSKHLCDSLFN